MKRFLQTLLVLVVVIGLCGMASAKVVIKIANAGPANPDNRTVKAVEIFKAMVKGDRGRSHLLTLEYLGTSVTI